MNRRLFLTQTASGFALQFLPTVLVANPFSREQGTLSTEPDRIAREIAITLQNGVIGTPERLYITHIYSPEQTSIPTLLTLVQRDFAWAEQLTGSTLTVDSKLLFAHSPSATFGSYSARFASIGLVVDWQGLARVGRQADVPTGTLLLAGSKGSLQVYNDKRSYQFLDLEGRTIKAANNSRYTLSRLS